MIRSGSIFSSLKGIRAYLNFDDIGPHTQLRWKLFTPLLEATDWQFGARVDLLDSNTKNALFDLNRRGFLHIHTIQGVSMYCLHSPLHLLYYQNQLLTSSVESISADASSLQSFLIACIPRFSKMDLCSTLSVGVDGRILERKLQFAFCLAATSVLPKSYRVCPDVGNEVMKVTHLACSNQSIRSLFSQPQCSHAHAQVFSISGLVDFWISPVNWAIELLRDGSNLREHEKRFELGGKYYSLPMGSYAVLDFRRQGTAAFKPRRLNPDTYVVLFSADYGQATLHHAGQEWQMTLSD
jgi:hypothetical protein